VGAAAADTNRPNENAPATSQRGDANASSSGIISTLNAKYRMPQLIS
jgi:hypothetical protein